MAAATSLAFAAPTTVAPATASHAAKATPKTAIVVLAPADEYFGPLKESFIGIRNTIRDLGLRYDVNHDISKQTLASAELTERAVRDWEQKYPHDTQIPKTIYLLQRLYTKVLTIDARNRAHATALWLFADYGKSGQAKQLKKTLAVEHLAPLPSAAPAAPSDAATATATAPSAASSAAPAPQSNQSATQNAPPASSGHN